MENAINPNNTNMEENKMESKPVINHARNFATAATHNYEDFFKAYENIDEKMKPFKNELREINKRITVIQEEVLKLYKTRYNKSFTPTEYKPYLAYESNRYNSPTLYFDIETGNKMFPSDVQEKVWIPVHKCIMKGEITYLKGYCLELGAIITQTSSYVINSKAETVKITPKFETVHPILEKHEKVAKDNIGNNITECVSTPDNYPAKEFLKLFYNMEIPETLDTLKLKDLQGYYSNNVNIEAILKTSPVEIMLDLIKKNFKEPMSIYQMLNITKPELKMLREKGITRKYYKLRETIESFPANYAKHVIKTTPEWIKLITRSLEWEKNFDFYHINYDKDGILIDIVRAYTGYYGGYSWNKKYNRFPEYYSFGNFCSYVIDSTINQGFTSLDNCIETLRDYLQMCEGANLKPILYSGYLTQTHNIASRNLKVELSENEEGVFTERYKEFKNWEDKKSGYALIAPETSKDVIQEGSDQSHCCGSYLHKILNGDCLILFLRKIEKLKQSLVTVEFCHGAIIQARGQFNRDMTEDEINILKKCCKENEWEYDV